MPFAQSQGLLHITSESSSAAQQSAQVAAAQAQLQSLFHGITRYSEFAQETLKECKEIGTESTVDLHSPLMNKLRVTVLPGYTGRLKEYETAHDTLLVSLDEPMPSELRELNSKVTRGLEQFRKDIEALEQQRARLTTILPERPATEGSANALFPRVI